MWATVQSMSVCLCVCVCVRERERERGVCMCVCGVVSGGDACIKSSYAQFLSRYSAGQCIIYSL